MVTLTPTVCFTSGWQWSALSFCWRCGERSDDNPAIEIASSHPQLKYAFAYQIGMTGNFVHLWIVLVQLYPISVQGEGLTPDNFINKYWATL